MNYGSNELNSTNKIIYFEILDQINKYTYNCIVPSETHIKLSKFESEPMEVISDVYINAESCRGPAPFMTTKSRKLDPIPHVYHPHPNTRSYTRLTVSDMIHCNHIKAGFELVNMADIENIYLSTVSYIQWCDQHFHEFGHRMSQVDKLQHETFTKRAIDFKEKAEKLLARYYKRINKPLSKDPFKDMLTKAMQTIVGT